MAKPKEADHSERTQQRLKQALTVAVVALVTVKVGLPVLGAMGRLLFGKKKQQETREQKPVVSGPSDDSWQVAPVPAPSIPADMKEVASLTLPCGVRDFYQRFVSGASDFQKRLHLELEERHEYSLGPWKQVPLDGQPMALGTPCNPDDSNALAATGRTPFGFVLGSEAGGGFIRSVVFVQPKKPPQSVDADCVQRQQFCVFEGGVLVLAIAQNMLNIPFKDCFTVNIVWVAKPTEDPNKCSLKVYAKVNFLKGVLVGGIIRMTTMNSNVAYWKKWGEAALREMASGAPMPAAQGAAARGGARGQGNAAFRAMHRGGAGASGGDGDGGEVQVHTGRQRLRFALVFLIIFVGVMNQLVPGMHGVGKLLRR